MIDSDFKYEFEWIINNYKSPTTRRFNCLQGESFCPKPGSLHKFCLELEFDCEYNDLYRGKWVLCLKKLRSEYVDLEVNCYLTIENANGEIWYEHASGPKVRVKEDKAQLMSKNFLGYYKDRLDSTFSWPDHKVILKGTLYFFGDNADNKFSGNMSSVICEQLQADLRKMYQNDVSCDITFCFGEEKLRAHKAILSCRSPMFQKMFDHNMQEKIVIEDFDIYMFYCFLLFLYTGKIEDSEFDTVLSLHKLAVKYQVESLRNVCWQTLGKELSIDSACSVLLFSVENNYYELKEITKSYIRKHFTEFERTNKWFEIVAELAREV